MINDSDLNDFMKQTPPGGKQSKLMPFMHQILHLKKKGYAEKEILQFLKEKKNIVVAQPTLNVFIRNCLNNKTASAAATSHEAAEKPGKKISPPLVPTTSTAGTRSFKMNKTPLKDFK